jgi:hypothetical protein
MERNLQVGRRTSEPLWHHVFLHSGEIADVIVNGTKASGNVYPQMRGPMQSSSAFLAFSESWVK